MKSPPALRVDPRAEEGALANSKMQRSVFRRPGGLGVPLRVELQQCWNRQVLMRWPIMPLLHSYARASMSQSQSQYKFVTKRYTATGTDRCRSRYWPK